MKVPLIVFLVSFQMTCQAASYINYLMIDTAIKHSLEENSRQKQIRSNQATDTSLEEANRKELNTFQQYYQKVEARMNSLGLLLDAGVLAQEAIPLVSSITESQTELLALLAEHPTLLISAAEVEAELADKAVSILSYMAGILLTYGELNRMKPSDRKMLLNFARDELRALDAQSYRLVRSLQQIVAMSQTGVPSFASWVNEDKKLIGAILTNAKALL